MAELRFLLSNNLAPANLRTNCPTNAAYQSVSFVRLLWDNDDRRRMATENSEIRPLRVGTYPTRSYFFLFLYAIMMTNSTWQLQNTKSLTIWHSNPDYLEVALVLALCNNDA